MAMDIPTLRKLLSLDPGDPLSRFALGKKLFETTTDPALLNEALDHLRLANQKDPNHLATYHILAQLLIKLGHHAEARDVIRAALPRIAAVGSGMGRDLGPALEALLAQLPRE